MRATAFHSGMHLTEGHVLAPEPACPLCSYRGERSQLLRLQSEPDVFLLACPNCGGCSASRLPTEEALRSYYSKYYERVVFQNAGRVTFDEPERFARHLMRKAGSFLHSQHLGILDFGGGDGKLSLAMARLLLKNGASHVHIVLVDYNAGSAFESSEEISLESHELLTGSEETNYDLVLASGILEHIPYPQKDFVRLLSALRPGGLFYARTPCVASLFGILQRMGLSVDFTYPAHVHDMGEAYWSSILSFLPAEFQDYSIICSQPSIVETTLRRNPVRTVAAHMMKFPWRVLGRWYPHVGGWEVLIQRSPTSGASSNLAPLAPASSSSSSR